MTSNFGDRRYLDCALTPHYVHQPGAPVQIGEGNNLRGAYFHAQNHARICLQQTYSFNGRNYRSDLATRRAARAAGGGAYIGIARGWRVIPDEVSHLIVVCQYFAVTWRPSLVEHRASIDNGSDVDVGTSQRYIDEDRTRQGLVNVATGHPGNISANEWVQFIGQYPNTLGFELREDVFEIELADVDSSNPGRCEIRVEVRVNALNQTAAAYDVSEPYGPLSVQVWTDMRYAT